MRRDLFYELSVIGYKFFLDGENIKLRYQKSDAPPESARQLIDELRQCKQEAIKILSANKYTAMWPSNMHGLIDWFVHLEPPAAPFDQEPHIHVIEPAKYLAS